jgi:hypothetical protein
MNRSLRAPLVFLPLLFVAAPAFAQTAAPTQAAPTGQTTAPAQATPPVDAAPPVAPAPSAPADAPTPPAVPPAPSSATPSGTMINLTTLRILKEKGIITQAEYDSAVRDMGESIGSRGAGEANTVVVGKWAATLYGFVEADSIYDSTQSLNDLAGSAQIQRLGTYAGNNARVQFGARNSRIGFRIKAPEVGGIRTSAQLEMDFLGNQLPVGPNNAAPTGTSPAAGSTGNGTDTEAQYFTSPAFRVRHMNLKIETPVVDFLFGQYWQLYGWQSVYHPNTVEMQGVPGQLYSRTPQIRISKSVKTDSFLFEIAVAAMRPPQRDSAIPEGQAGIRIGTPAWSGVTTNGATGTSIQPLSIAVTGDARSFTVPQYANTATPTVSGPSKLGTSIAVDAFIPIIPAKKRQGNALSVSGEFSTGYGNADLYTGLSGGAPAPNYTVTTKGVASTLSADVDPGLVMYDNLGNLHLIQWSSWLIGLQYYLPGLDGKVWLSGNISNVSSSNLQNGFGTPSKTRLSELWGDGNIFWDATDSVRLGFETAMFDDEYVDRTHAQNIRAQFSAFYIF